MTSQEAQARLLGFRTPGWLETRRTAIRRLPETVQPVATALATRSISLLRGSLSESLDGLVMDGLDRLTDHERRDVFGALWPRMAETVERGWHLMHQRTYHARYRGRHFRAPTVPQAYRRDRMQWVAALGAVTADYNADVVWLSAWAPHLDPEGALAPAIGALLAAAIDAGGHQGEEVLRILMASAAGQHEIGLMGHHVIRALLNCARPEAWQCLEDLLLNAQREEGLRWAILRVANEGHLSAFRRLLRLVLDQGLMRFEAVCGAAAGWFDLSQDMVTQTEVEHLIVRAITFLDDGGALEAALSAGEPAELSLALWTLGWRDAAAAGRRAAEHLTGPSVERRYVAVRLLGKLGLDEVEPRLLEALADPDLRVALEAWHALRLEPAHLASTDLFERLEALLARMPHQETVLPSLVHPWRTYASAGQVAMTLFECRGSRPFERLLPLAEWLEPCLRCRLIESVRGREATRPTVREFLLRMLGDASPEVRSDAGDLLRRTGLQPAEAPAVEALLTRRAADLRGAALQLLLKQPDEAALASAERLLAAKDGRQRLAGLEMLRTLAKNGHLRERCRAAASAYRNAHPQPSTEEQTHLDQLDEPPARELAPHNGFGLYDPAALTPAISPQRLPLRMVTRAAVGLVESLRSTLVECGDLPILDRGETRPFSQCFPPRPAVDALPPAQRTPDRLPLMDRWLSWYDDRPNALRDADGLELVRALWIWRLESARRHAPDWYREWVTPLIGAEARWKGEPHHWVEPVLLWLTALVPPPGPPAAALLVDSMETALAILPAAARRWRKSYGSWEPADLSTPRLVVQPCGEHRRLHPSAWVPAQLERVFRLQIELGEPANEAVPPTADGGDGDHGTRLPVRRRPLFDDALAAFDAGVLGEADLLDYLVGEPQRDRTSWLYLCTERRPSAAVAASPGLRPLVDRVRETLLRLELARGDRPSPATEPISHIATWYGVDVLVRALSCLGKDGLSRDSYGEGKGERLSQVVRDCLPLPEDTPAAAGAAIRAAGLPDQLLCNVALAAPQWAPHLAVALGWDGFESGVWWLYAHSKDERWGVSEDALTAWRAKVTEHTPLSSQDLLDGAVDVAWFGQVYQALGEQRFQRLYNAAKFGTSGSGHTRARLFADAMLGRVDRATMLARATEKRQQDALRALGLVPLATGEEREADVLLRYEAICEFQRTSRKFGPQRRASEARAAAVALDNLARTAGYPDPIRLQWAMEGRAVADLKAGPVTVAVDSLTVALSITPAGLPELSVARAGKPLKSIPAAVAKDPGIVALKARKTSLDRAASRMKGALETAMCRGDRFTGRELAELLEHPLLAPLLADLVWLGEGLLGYPAAGGQALRHHSGELLPLGRHEVVRLAHPVDLLAAEDWHLWQRECLTAQRVQPLKQVFRELYRLTAAEREEGDRSRRYAGHQVHSRQAMALLSQRSWVFSPEVGLRRTWHEAGLSAWLDFEEHFHTPLEVEDATLDTVHFSRRGEWRPMALDEVPPAIFSEAMRDLDLVVSVAHRSGVDPDATSSTVEFRAALVRETCALMGLDNVRLDQRQALIDGHFGSYAVHLGSAVTHQLPGGMLFIVPVHSQHRGRLFLPFADDDPKTAEVLSKVLLLARDKQIKDPTILAAIRR